MEHSTTSSSLATWLTPLTDSAPLCRSDPFQRIPNEIMYNILGLLKPEQLVVVKGVSKAWKTRVEGFITPRIVEQTFRRREVTRILAKEMKGEPTWADHAFRVNGKLCLPEAINRFPPASAVNVPGRPGIPGREASNSAGGTSSAATTIKNKDAESQVQYPGQKYGVDTAPPVSKCLWPLSGVLGGDYTQIHISTMQPYGSDCIILGYEHNRSPDTITKEYWLARMNFITGQAHWKVKLEGPHSAFSALSYFTQGAYIYSFAPINPGFSETTEKREECETLLTARDGNTGGLSRRGEVKTPNLRRWERSTYRRTNRNYHGFINADGTKIILTAYGSLWIYDTSQCTLIDQIEMDWLHPATKSLNLPLRADSNTYCMELDVDGDRLYIVEQISERPFTLVFELDCSENFKLVHIHQYDTPGNTGLFRGVLKYELGTCTYVTNCNDRIDNVQKVAFHIYRKDPAPTVDDAPPNSPVGNYLPGTTTPELQDEQNLSAQGRAFQIIPRTCYSAIGGTKYMTLPQLDTSNENSTGGPRSDIKSVISPWVEDRERYLILQYPRHEGLICCDFGPTDW
ncbi:hypothetical protein Dda_7066 [Drechslerella dactyloides]|uniref:F-box domain-containing protein n=1 Tax=Drechslerella dactyloides TaxID=74499 RepID=A0AAD6IT43_DREDA|nr:hypothetical protein Dda_7066 [Drechslerella dactyloides]